MSNPLLKSHTSHPFLLASFHLWITSLPSHRFSPLHRPLCWSIWSLFPEERVFLTCEEQHHPDSNPPDWLSLFVSGPLCTRWFRGVKLCVHLVAEWVYNNTAAADGAGKIRVPVSSGVSITAHFAFCWRRILSGCLSCRGALTHPESTWMGGWRYQIFIGLQKNYTNVNQRYTLIVKLDISSLK